MWDRVSFSKGEYGVAPFLKGNYTLCPVKNVGKDKFSKGGDLISLEIDRFLRRYNV